MKKIFFSIFLLVFGLCLVGCDIESNHQHISCQECGKCIADDCDGADEEKCQVHQPLHKHTECQECGKCIADDCDGAEELKCSGHEHHIFKLTIIDEDNLIYDKPTETSCESDTKIVMHSHPLIDADLAMYINGEFHSIQNTIIVNDEYVWEYSFIMPERDTTIEFKTQALEYFNVKTILGIPSLTREDILRIIYHTIYLSSDPIPGSLRIVISTTDYEDITDMLRFLDANVVEDRSNNWQEDAGSCEKHSICTIDKKYDFEIINGYISVNNKHYKLLGYGPGMSYGNITSAFNTNLDTYEAYTLEGTKIGDFNGLSEFEFYEIDGPLTSVDDYGYLETEFGRIYIHDSKIFYIKNGESYTYYELAWEWEKDFSDIFGKHKHNECEVCGKCVDIECTGKEDERCNKSYLVTLESHQYISFTDSLEDLQFYIIQDYSQYIEFIQKNEIKEIYYDEENNIHYNEDIANQFTEEFFIDSVLVLISYFTATSLDDLTVIKSYELENGILNIKFGVPKSDLIPKNNCYLVYMFKCDKHILDDFVTVEYMFGVKN